MLKKLFASVAVVAFLAGTAAAQDDVSQYTSGAPAPETPMMNINEVASSEPTFAISLHPWSMIIYTGVLGVPSIFLTVEGNINSNASIITRPYYLGKSWEHKDRETREKEEIDLNLFGISEGFRYYFNRGHAGYFASFHVMYEYVGIDYEYSGDHDDDFSVSGNSLGIGVYLGSKTMWSRCTSSWDIGVTYSKAFIKGDSKDDVEEVTSVGFGIDLNYTIGFAI
ncbi:MAG: DUF3575 domain-containing protein [Fibrobacter sp.]|nr:DUF3575 domain-containing protein [Fibrobacter sp.]